MWVWQFFVMFLKGSIYDWLSKVQLILFPFATPAVGFVLISDLVPLKMLAMIT